jgi:3-methyladenine DNA glycosylase AlkD
MPRKENSRKQLEQELEASADPTRAEGAARFFKTGKGHYGEGDRFLGITVPQQRRLALKYKHMPLPDISKLLASKKHEYRLCALKILAWQFEHAGAAAQDEIFRFYLQHTSRINNWDLVDTSAPHIAGEYVRTRSRQVLYELAVSENLWERRIAVVATLTLIKHGETDDAYRIVQGLLRDKHDLVQKACGWVLREAGKLSRPVLLRFIRRHYATMPRTTLRYAIEHLPAEQRKLILAVSSNLGRPHRVKGPAD